MEVFTALSFGLCAAMFVADGDDYVKLGETIAGECEPFVYLQDTGGRSAVIKDHDISVLIFDDGAEVTVDNRKFIVPKLKGA